MKNTGAESYYPKSRKAKYPLKAPKELCLIMDYRIWVTVTHKWQKFTHIQLLCTEITGKNGMV